MQHMIATVSISGTLEEKIAAIAAAGYDGLEIFENDLLASDLRPAEVRQRLADHDLVCGLYQPFRDFEGLRGPARALAFDRMRRKFDLMGELGTDRLLVCSSVSPEADGDHERIIDDFRELGPIAAERGIRIGYEALAWGRNVFDHRDAWAIVKAVDHPAIGILLDSFHSLARGIPIESIAEIDPARITFVQLADAPLLTLDPLSWSRHFRNMPGEGDLAVTAYVAALRAIGYDGPLSLEIFNDRFRAGSTAIIAADGLRSLRAVEEDAARINAAPARFPPRAQCSAVSFIEFAASAEEAKPLGTMLGAMGFRHAARHHAKQVDLWRQGAINIVVNQEAQDFAHSYDIMHGASVCAVGLTVDDRAAALDRADALAIARFDQPVPAHDLTIPALRGVAGSLLYLLSEDESREVWSHEFVAVDGDGSGTDAGLSRIDHLAASVEAEEFLSWQLYWSSMFDMVRSGEVNVADPSGLVQSRALQTPDGAVRVTLNASQGQRTLSTRFLGRTFGGGFHHLAFATDDIFATAATMRANGLAGLEIPTNYYDDLAARFGLDEAAVARMADYGILYDRDGDGEYYQFYTRALDKRFFFEIVQRRGGYQGYGPGNAAIRLAAQSRFRTTMP